MLCSPCVPGSWTGLFDLDLVVEGSAEELAKHSSSAAARSSLSELRVHGSYGTVELVLDEGFV